MAESKSTSARSAELRFCPGCGMSLKAGAKFCAQCGFDLATLAAGGKSGAGSTMALVLGVAAVFVGGIAYLALRNQAPPPAPGAAPRGPADVMTQAAAQGQGAMSTAVGASSGGAATPQVSRAQIEEALKPLRDAVAAAPDAVEAKVRLGFGLYRASTLVPEFIHEAEKVFREVLAKDPENVDANVSLANVYYDLGRASDAIPYYEKFLAKNPDEPSVGTDLGTMYLYTGRVPDAIRQYESVLSKHPDFVNGWFNLGNAYDAQRNGTKALEAYRKAEALNPPDELKQSLENAVAKLEGRAPKQVTRAPGGELPPGHPPLDAAPALAGAGDAGAPPAATQPTSPGPQGEVETLLKNHPVFGSKIARFEWDNDTQIKVWTSGFPMSQMPEAMRSSFLAKIGAGLKDIHTRAGGTAVYRVEIVDDATGAVMATTEG